MSSRNTNDPPWRKRAAQMRALALTMKDPEVAILMTDLAADSHKLADQNRGEEVTLKVVADRFSKSGSLAICQAAILRASLTGAFH